jgi:CubicO group peptidase (beta-lactamase class C family)
LAIGLPAGTSDSVGAALRAFANGNATVVTPPIVPPGHFGLLRRVLAGENVPDYADPFLPLIRDRLGAGATIGAQVDTITLHDLLTHWTGFAENPAGPLTPEEQASLATDQPMDGLATIDYWAFVRLLLRDDVVRPANPGVFYKNSNFTILTTIIEACTDTTFDDYVTRRLFADERFRHVRRRVVDRDRDAFYYSGSPPNWAGGVRFSDYSNWPGNGGFYATANQLTDWLHALYTGEVVAGAIESAPLISVAGRSKLFDTTGYFSLGISNRGGPAASSQRYQHNGGTGGNGGSVNGNVAIIVSPAGPVFTALFVANGSVGADPPWDAVVSAVTWN